MLVTNRPCWPWYDCAENSDGERTQKGPGLLHRLLGGRGWEEPLLEMLQVPVTNGHEKEGKVGAIGLEGGGSGPPPTTVVPSTGALFCSRDWPERSIIVVVWVRVVYMGCGGDLQDFGLSPLGPSEPTQPAKH